MCVNQTESLNPSPPNELGEIFRTQRPRFDLLDAGGTGYHACTFALRQQLVMPGTTPAMAELNPNRIRGVRLLGEE